MVVVEILINLNIYVLNLLNLLNFSNWSGFFNIRFNTNVDFIDLFRETQML
jgi:hypothetical protein